MSYILEALRKADAQRERSRLPGLQAQPHAATGAQDRSAPRIAWFAAVAALVAGFGGFAVWQLLRGQAVPAIEAVALPPAPAVAAAALPAAPAAEILPPAPPPLPAPLPAAVKTPAAVKAQAPAKDSDKAPLQGVPAGAPSLAVSGGVWSQNPAQRLLIANGQVFNEGSELAPGVRLEEVKQHRAVLSFRGQRYEVPY